MPVTWALVQKTTVWAPHQLRQTIVPGGDAVGLDFNQQHRAIEVTQKLETPPLS